MWDYAFKYTEDEQMAYTMWWNEGGNPNDLITQNLGRTVPDQCDLSWSHKGGPPSPEESLTECRPWRADACCLSETVVSPEAMNEVYGVGYGWDRCGPLSHACERFFVGRACLWECEVNAGLYRKYTDAQHAACSADGVTKGAAVTLSDGTAYTCTVGIGGGNGNDENRWQVSATDDLNLKTLVQHLSVACAPVRADA